MNYFDLSAGDLLQIEIGAGSVPPSSGTNYVDGGASILRINSVQKMYIPGGRHGEQPFPLKTTSDPTGVLHGYKGYSPFYQGSHSRGAKQAGGWVAFQDKKLDDTHSSKLNFPSIVFDPNDWGLRGKIFDSALGLGVLQYSERGRNLMVSSSNYDTYVNGLGMGATQGQNGGLAGRGGGGFLQGRYDQIRGGDGYAFVWFYAEI